MGDLKRYHNKPKIIKACQWHKMGDYPVEGIVKPLSPFVLTVEGQKCTHCDRLWTEHGGMDTPEGYHRVCPTDYVCTGIEGEMYPCKANIFEASYDEIKEQDSNGYQVKDFEIRGQ